MICLDTNYLIGALVAGSSEAAALTGWSRAGEVLAASAVAWYEFTCGPVGPEEIEIVRSCLGGRILPFGEAEAAEASRLFNEAGRPRRLRVDAMIAGAAVAVGGMLATANAGDFAPFVTHGLVLAETP